jgi:hypothetical protein
LHAQICRLPGARLMLAVRRHDEGRRCPENAMNWEAISAIGQVAGAIAVVATLLYVARQTSINTKAVMAQTAREVDLYVGNLHLEVARDPELKRIAGWSFQSTMPEFSDAQWYEFRQFAIALMLPFQAQYIHGQLRVGPADHGQLYVRIAKGLITDFPVWRKFWEDEQQAQSFMPEFFKAVNDSRERSSFAHIARKAPQ